VLAQVLYDRLPRGVLLLCRDRVLEIEDENVCTAP
jgi:hypothetical protein